MGYFFILVPLLISLWYFWHKRPDPPKIGAYSQPGKYYALKKWLMGFVISRRQQKSKQGQASDDVLDTQFGGGGQRNVAKLESKHELPKDCPRAGDCVYWDGSNKDRWNLHLGMAQRQDNIINLFFIVRIPGVGTFVNEDLPSTSNVKSLPSETEYVTESGFKAVCEEPMKTWRLLFDGNLVPVEECRPNLSQIGPDKVKESLTKIKAKFDLLWTGRGPHFDFDVDISPEAIGDSIAREPWSKELFQKLKESHQLHYEQFGVITGSVQVNDFKEENVNLVSMRDHTITKYRDWSDLRRYIMIIYHLEDGTCIHTSIISMPDVVFSHLQFGYMITKDLQKIPVDNINFNLWEHGEDKHFPKKFSYSFRAGGEFYSVEIEIKETVKFKMGLDLATYVEENLCEFRCNGIKGWGNTEAEYRINPY